MRSLLLIITLLALASGCATQPSKYVSATGKMTEDLSLAHKQVADLIPATTGEVRGRLMGIQGIVESMLKIAPVLEQGAADYAKEVQKNAALIADFWSPRQHALFWWIFGGSLAIVIGLGFAYSLGGAAVAGGILGAVGKVFYYGFHFLTLGFVAIFSKLHADVQAAAKTSQALNTATAKANKTGATARVQVTGAAHVTAEPQVVIASQVGSADKPISTTAIG